MLASNAMQGKADVAIVQRLYRESGELVAEQAFYEEGCNVLEREGTELVVEHSTDDGEEHAPDSLRTVFEALREPVSDSSKNPVIEVSTEYGLNGGREYMFALPKIEPDNYFTYMRSILHTACQGIPLITQTDDIMYIDRYVRTYGLVHLSGTEDKRACEVFRKQFFLDAIERTLQERLPEDDTAAKTPIFRLVKGQQLEFVCKLAHVGHAEARGELEMPEGSMGEQIAVATYDISSRVPKIKREGKEVFGSMLIVNSENQKNLAELVNKYMDKKTVEDLVKFFK